MNMPNNPADEDFRKRSDTAAQLSRLAHAITPHMRANPAVD